MENKESIQLILSDIIMPKKNGREAYEEIKKINPDVKALFISGYATDVIQQRGIQEEGFHLILKPVLPNQLLRKVREVLDHEEG